MTIVNVDVVIDVVVVIVINVIGVIVIVIIIVWQLIYGTGLNTDTKRY